MKYKVDVFKKGVKAGIPIALGYFAVSFSFGMLAVTYGLSALDAVIISFTNLTSAGQFAGLTVITTAGSYLEMVLTQFIINLRYSLMSFSLSQKLDNSEPFNYRYIVGFGITDEIFALSISEPHKISAFFNFGAMTIAVPGWVIGTLLGGLLGNVLPSSITSALSVSLYGMFVAIIIPLAKKNKAILYAIISAMIISSIIAYVPIFKSISAGFSIIIVTVFVSAIVSFIAPIKEEK